MVSWLGGVAVTRGDRRHGGGYIRHPWAVGDTASLTSSLSTSATKENVSECGFWTASLLFATAHCRQTKRSPWIQKGKQTFCFLLRCLILPTVHLPWTLGFGSRTNPKFSVFSLQTMKPLMEKRRRARINESLNKLKTLIIPLTGRDVSYLHRDSFRKRFKPPLVMFSVE